MTTITNIYGNICDYQTGATIRPATLQDWITARLTGDAQTGAHRTEESGERPRLTDRRNGPMAVLGRRASDTRA